jgi:outer membrane protein OmpA-like peptidoglycan-associated protein
VAESNGGLVTSQQARLDEIVGNFKDYLTVRPEAKLILEAHADIRGSQAFNQALSQRRADRVKNYLVEHGIPAASIETRAFGKDKNLTNKEVEELNAKNPNVTDEARERVKHNIVPFRMANNRRVDLHLSTTGQTSLRYFPYNSDDLNVLLGEQKPVAKKATHAGKKPAAK